VNIARPSRTEGQDEEEEDSSNPFEGAEDLGDLEENPILGDIIRN
jgi:hypothetical protein